MSHSYTTIPEAGVVTCNDCGAHAETVEQIEHYASCVAGEAQKWEAFYKDAEHEI
jgi:hypothetical protein